MKRLTQLNSKTVVMRIRCTLIAGLLFAGIAACSGNDNGTQAAGGNTYIRFVNSTYQQEADVASGAACTFGAQPAHCDTVTTTYTAIPIDILIDSAATYPSSVALAANSVDTGTAGPKPLLSAGAGYHPFAVGVHSFVARVNGLVTPGPSFFTTTSNTQYLPRQFLTNTTYYTFVLSGINPVQTDPSNPTLAGPSDFGSGFPLLLDDPFTPPSVTPLSGAPYLQARFRVHNSAMWTDTTGGNNGIAVYLTHIQPTLSALGLFTPVAGYVSRRTASGYVNVTAGDYWLTIVPTDFSLLAYQALVHFDAGEVRSLFLQNAMLAFHRRMVTVSATTGGGGVLDTHASYDQPVFKMTNILDNKYSL